MTIRELLQAAIALGRPVVLVLDNGDDRVVGRVEELDERREERDEDDPYARLHPIAKVALPGGRLLEEIDLRRIERVEVQP